MHLAPRARGQFLSHAAIAAAILAMYIALDFALRRIALPRSGIIAVYPGAGLGLAFLIVAGPIGAIPMLVVRLGLVGFARLGAPDWPVLLFEAALQIAGYTVAAEAIRRRVLGGLEAWRIKHAVWLIGASILPAIVAALASGLQLMWTHPLAAPLWMNVLTFAAADSAGTLVVLPPALLAIRPLLLSPDRAKRSGMVDRATGRTRIVERIVAGVFVAATIAIGARLSLTGAEQEFAYLQLLCVLPVAWIAIREGFDGAVFVVAAYGAGWTFFAFNVGGPALPVAAMQSSILTLAVVGLLLGAARTESDENSAQYWHMVASAGEGVWRLDTQGNSLYLNDQMLKLLGAPASDVIGRPVSEYIHPEDRERWLAERDRRTRGEDTLYEVRLLRPDGGVRHVLVRGSVARNTKGESIGAIAIVTDVTALRAAEASGQRAQVLLEAAFHSSSEGMILFRVPDELIVDVNEIWCQIVGYRRDEVLGRRLSELRLWGDPADSVRLAEAIREHGSVRDLEVPFNRRLPNGTVERGYVLIAATPVHDGSETFFLVTGRDTTLERRREAAERQLRRLEELGRLAGSISHDFNNLLTVVLGYAQLASMDLESGKSVADDLVEIERAAQRGQHLTKRLLAFSRSQPVQTRVVDLRAIVDQAHGMLRSAIGPAVKLEIGQADHPLRILADPSQVDQILLNLALNARDAMSGSGTLTIRTSSVTAPAGRVADIVGPGALPGDYILLEVIDTGTGMDDATQARIFEPFFTTKPPDEGTGLGLAVVFGIVRQARGTVRVWSAPAQGARFSIYWPLAAITEMPSTEEIAGPVAEGADLRGTILLLVEDDDTVRKIVKRVLEDAGYSVHTASNGVQAIVSIKELDAAATPASLVVSDVIMPEMGGRRLAEHLLADHPDLPVVLLSGHVGTEDDLRAGLPNVKELMMKPFDVRALLDVLARIVSERARVSVAPPGPRFPASTNRD